VKNILPAKLVTPSLFKEALRALLKLRDGKGEVDWHDVKCISNIQLINGYNK
jgi:hypothetical protein